VGQLVVIKANPATNDSTSVLQGFKAVAMQALILQGADHQLHHPISLWAVGRDEFLLQAIAFNQCGVTPADKC
jgi:hypothetical protein